jgi:hypothetical protein
MTKLFSLNIPWDVDVIGKVMRKRERFAIDIRSSGDL